MPLVDKQGRVLGRVNIIDAIIGICAIVLVVFVITTVAPSNPPTYSATVEFEASVPSHVGGAATSDAASMVDGQITAGPYVDAAWTNETERQGYQRIFFVAEINATREDGLYYYKGERLFVGSHKDVDLTITRFNATIERIKIAGEQQ